VETGRTPSLHDEPTTAHHFEDVRMLPDVLDRLTDRGNTVIVIEHNVDVMKRADWIIDLGPEGGDEGGRIVAEGTPETVARASGSHTGTALRAALERAVPRRARAKAAV
jgi:excinuclease ABC subunit A